MSIAARFYSLALVATAALADGEIWNSGVDAYEKGDVTNALRILRPLLTSKSHAARASAIIAKLEKEAGEFESAAASAQIALRADPDDEVAIRNFTRAIDGVKAKRESAHIDSVLKSARGGDAGAMLERQTAEARDIMEEAGYYRTNLAERAVERADALSARASALADAWIPLREAIANSVTNEEQASTILLQLDRAKEKTLKAEKELADMDGEAYATMSEVEHDFNRFLKLVALPPQAMALDEVAQSNAWQDAEVFNGRAWQPEALEFTRSFRAKFPAWARAYEAEAQADTNRAPFTAESQAKISALATELEKLQLACCEKEVPANQERALGIISEIRELLPKDKGGQGGASGKSEANAEPQEQKGEPKNDKGESQAQEGTDEADEPENEEEKENYEEKNSEAASENEDEREDGDVESTLKKAQERNDEHEADKKSRMRKSPLPPNERDW